MLSLFAVAVAPGIAIVGYIYSKDKYDHEPFKNLAISFFLGVLATVPPIIIQTFGKSFLTQFYSEFSLTYNFIFAFLVVACSEEGSKFIMVRAYAYRQPAFNDPFDGIVYSVMVSMGFATLENVLYVINNGLATGLVRMFLSVPAHACFAVLMGYQIGLAKFDPARSSQHMLKGFLLAVFFHGSFDFFLFLQNNPNVAHYVSNNMLIGGALVSYWIAIRLSLRSIRLQQEYSRQMFKK